MKPVPRNDPYFLLLMEPASSRLEEVANDYARFGQRGRLHAIALCGAADRADSTEMRALLAAGATQQQRNIALIQAAISGCLPCVHALLAAGAEVDARNCCSRTALMEAALGGKRDIVAALLAARADPGLADRRGWTALELAVDGGHVAATRQLLAALGPEYASSAVESTRGLVLALARCFVEAAHCLLAEGPLMPAWQVVGLLHHCSGPKEQLFATLAARQPLADEQWGQVPSPCPGLGTALPAVLQRSAGEAALLVRHLSPAERERLRVAALSLHRAQQHWGHPLPTPIVWQLLGQAAV